MATSQSFEDWFSARLLSLDPDIDTDVFVMYINGILETDDTTEEKKDSMSEILSEVIPENSSAICDEILKKWEEIKGIASQSNQLGSQDLASQLSSMLENQKIESVKPKEKSKEEIERKAAILAAYSQVSDEEREEERPDDPGGDGTDSLMQKNSNADNVTKQEKEKREKSKQEAEKKKEKDKTDREAQKQKQQDRKESEKKRTQKGERRR